MNYRLTALLLFITGFCFAQSLDFRFENISHKHQQLHTQINDIIEDHRGFIWIGSTAGLYRFDGVEFVSYHHDPLDSTSLSNPGVIQVAEDKSGNIWVSTNYGIDLLDRLTGEFRNFAPFNKKTSTKSQNNINTLFVDSKNRIWAAGVRNLFLFDTREYSFSSLVLEDENMSMPFVRDVIEDQQGNIWFGTSEGLFQYNEDPQNVSRVYSGSSLTSGESNIVCMSPWTDDQLLLGTYDGIVSYSLKTGLFKKLSINPVIDLKGIRDIQLSSDSLIWMAVEDDGLCIYDHTNNDVRMSSHSDGDLNSVQNNVVRCILKDGFDNLWFGTSSGLSKLMSSPNGFDFFQVVNGIDQSANHVLRLHRDSNHNMWYTTAKGVFFKAFGKTYAEAVTGFSYEDKRIGDWIFETPGGKVLLPVTDEGIFAFSTRPGAYLEGGLETDIIRARTYKIIPDGDNADKLWIGTLEGLAEYSLSAKTVQWHRPKKQIEGLNTDRFPIYDQLGSDIWLYYTFFNSLGKMDKESGRFELFRPRDDKQYVLEGTIKDIAISADSNIWVATLNGLARYDIGNDTYNLYTTHNGLANNNLNALIIDQNERIWVSGDRFVSRFDPDTEKFQNFEALNKVKSFWSKSRFIDEYGRIYFGGLDGYYTFHPDSLHFDLSPPKLLLTDFKVQGKSFMLDTTYESAHHIVLNHKQNDITFDFVGIQLNNPDQVRYRCKLEGYDHDWKELGNSSSSNYTNLNHGDYTFLVQSSTLDGVWHDNALQLGLKIKTPTWKTDWFRSLVVLLCLILLYLSYRIWSYQQLLRRQKEIAEKSSEFKMRFLAHASHEIRTPMNAILGMSGLIKETDLDKKQEKYANAIQQSSKNLLSIINELLDHARIETGKFSITQKPFGLEPAMQQLKFTFETLALEKGLEFELNVAKNIPDILIGDELRLNQILTNILANAIKYTREGLVKLDVSLYILKDNVCKLKFEISDTGSGIDKAMLDTVFDRFTKEEKSDSLYSSGLGLYITRELVEAYNGSIKIASELGRGTRVNCIIPFGIGQAHETTQAANNAIPLIPALKVLIVDDAEFNHLVLRNMLDTQVEKLTLYTAYDGEEAIELYKRNDIELIVMDAKMPIMDGLKATQVIRSLEPQYGSVAILGATAGAMPDQIRNCLDVGMDDVIVKPISKSELMEKINKLMVTYGKD